MVKSRLASSMAFAVFANAKNSKKSNEVALEAEYAPIV